MDDLPPWLVMQSDDPVLRSVLDELFGNERFRSEMDAVFGRGEDRPSFRTYVGDAGTLETFNALRPDSMRVRLDPNTGGAAMYGAVNGPVRMGGIFVDVDRLHKAVGQDSARAREMVRDAFLHEFAHLHSVAVARDMSARTGDPTGNDAGHPAIQGENRLRAIFDLPAKTMYGLMGLMR